MFLCVEVGLSKILRFSVMNKSEQTSSNVIKELISKFQAGTSLVRFASSLSCTRTRFGDST